MIPDAKIDREYVAWHTTQDPTFERVHACNCIGPQNGQPKCPCAMRNVQVRDGRYVEIIDHGPVRAW